MTVIRVKRVYEDAVPEDGYRVLVDRLWPHGMKKESLNYDVWEKGITPSSELRAWFHEDMIEHWEPFAELYRKELNASDEMNAFIKHIKEYPIVTLLYASKELVHNHARLLQDYIQGKI